MERDFNGYMPPFMDYGMPPFGAPQDANDPMLNPIMQYEQAYSYYKYLCMQMDYKIGNSYISHRVLSLHHRKPDFD